MKRLVVIVVVLYTYCLSAQSEFSARAFYTDFNKVIDEASKGFVALMGEKRNSDFPGLTSEYEVKLILPLADSGKIVLSSHARPYVLYFFEPSRSRLKIDVKGADLRDAMTIAFNRPVCTRTETVLSGEIPISNTWFFEGTSELPKSMAICLVSVFSRNDLYYLTLQINGEKR